jgi:hypothetical protein
MTAYYRILEVNPPNLDTVKILLHDYHAIHVGTWISDQSHYRTFLINADEDTLIILKLLYSHIHFNKLSDREIADFTEKGYIR